MGFVVRALLAGCYRELKQKKTNWELLVQGLGSWFRQWKKKRNQRKPTYFRSLSFHSNDS